MTTNANETEQPVSTQRALGFGEALGIVALVFVPAFGLLGLAFLGFGSLRPHTRGLARAALLWHALLWTALLACVLYLIGLFGWALLHMGPVR